MGLKFCRVVATHPDDASIDCVDTKTGERMVRVIVLGSARGTDFGSFHLPAPLPGSGDQWDIGSPSARMVFCAVHSEGGTNVCLGFYQQQVSQMTFTDPNLAVNRHVSGTYSTIDGDGNVELIHPSGAAIMMSTSQFPVPRDGTDFDKQWKVTSNTDKKVTITVSQPNGAATVTIDPNGNVYVTCNSNVQVNAKGDIGFQSGGDTLINAGGNIGITASGNVSIQGTRIDLNQ